MRADDKVACPLNAVWLSRRKKRKSVENVLCSSKNVSIFAADFAAHVLLTIDAHALVKSRV